MAINPDFKDLFSELSAADEGHPAIEGESVNRCWPLLLALVPACIAEGRYEIRGRVVANGAPMAGVSVVADGGKTGGSDRVDTDADGRYHLTYGFGGMCVLILCTSYSDGHPRLIFSRPDQPNLSVEIRSDAVAPGVIRGDCEAGKRPRCYTVDVDLTSR